MIAGIPHDQIDQWWPLVEPFVARGLEYADGKFTTDDIREALKTRDMQLWIANTLDSIGITQVVIYPRKKVCLVVMVAGSYLDRWVDEMETTFVAWAKERGCHSIEAFCRPGWEKVLPDWHKLHVVLGREL